MKLYFENIPVQGELNREQKAHCDAIAQQYGNTPTIIEIETYFSSIGLTKSRNYIYKLKNHLALRHNEYIDQHIPKLAALLSLNPKQKDVEVALIKLGMKGAAVHSWWKILKKKRPELWNDKKDNWCHIVLREMDLDLLEKVNKTFGDVGVGESMSIVLRAFALLQYRQQVNVVELVSTAKRLRGTDIEVLKQSFNINLKNI